MVPAHAIRATMALTCEVREMVTVGHEADVQRPANNRIHLIDEDVQVAHFCHPITFPQSLQM